MKIILLKDVKKQGKSGDILDVKDGYGQFLINRKEAVMATSYSVDRLNRENKEKEIEENNKIEECKKLKNKLEKEVLKFKVKVGDADRVFGTISAKQIVEELKKLGYNIDKKQINIITPISSLGVTDVNVSLHKKVEAVLKVQLVK